MVDSAIPLSRGKRIVVLAAAFAAWMCAGLQISLFVLIHRQLARGLLGLDTPEPVITQWFAWYQAAFLFGAATGGWVFGWLGDRFGRARSMGLAVVCYSAFTGAAYFVDSASAMWIIRFLACLGIGGVWPNAVALVAEAWPDASRPFLAGLLGTAANVGFVILGVIGYYCEISDDAWRWTFLVGAAPIGLGLIILLVVPESRRWQANRAVAAGTAKHSPIREVLRPPLLSRTVLGIALGAIPVVGSAANANWLVPWTDHAVAERARVESSEKPKKPDSRSKARTQITRSGGAVIGSLIGGIVASALGRRRSYFLISLGACAASSVVFGMLDPLHPYFQWASFALGLIGIMYFGWLPLFLPELFPTRARTTGAGISFNTGRVVAAIVVLSAGMLLDLFGGNYSRVGLASGMIYLVGAVIIWAVPRRTEGKLED